MKLKPISYMVLGMLHLGATSGYAIKKAAGASTSAFWPVSLAQVYPELARLEKNEMVTRREDPQGARARAAYELTEKGRTALLDWLRSPDEAPIQFRVEGMLRFFFADALPRPEQIAMARRAQERLREYRDHMYDKGLPGAFDADDEEGIRTPLLAGLFGESLLLHGEEWMAQLGAQMETESEAGRRKRA